MPHEPFRKNKNIMPRSTRTPRAHRSNPALLSTTCVAARRETQPSTATPRPRSPTRHHSRMRSNPSGLVELSRNSGLYSEYNVPIYDLNEGLRPYIDYNIVMTPCVIQTAIIWSVRMSYPPQPTTISSARASIRLGRIPITPTGADGPYVCQRREWLALVIGKRWCSRCWGGSPTCRTARFAGRLYRCGDTRMFSAYGTRPRITRGSWVASRMDWRSCCDCRLVLQCAITIIRAAKILC